MAPDVSFPLDELLKTVIRCPGGYTLTVPCKRNKQRKQSNIRVGKVSTSPFSCMENICFLTLTLSLSPRAGWYAGIIYGGCG